MMRRILLAYAFFDTEVGYVQGLNFIVANLLWHSSEEQAFWALISMMYLYDLRCMFLPVPNHIVYSHFKFNYFLSHIVYVIILILMCCLGTAWRI